MGDEAEGGAEGSQDSGQAIPDGPVVSRGDKPSRQARPGSSIADIAEALKASARSTPKAEQGEEDGDDDPDGGEPAPAIEATDDEQPEPSEEEEEEGEEEEVAEPLDEKTVLAHPKVVEIVKARDQAQQFHRETYDFLLKSIEREHELEDLLEDAQDMLKFMEGAVDAAGFEVAPTAKQQLELQRKLRAYERKEKRSKEGAAQQEIMKKAARERSFRATVEGIAQAHGVKSEKLIAALKYEHAVAKLEGRAPKNPDAVAKDLAPKAKTPAPPERRQPPAPMRAGRGGRVGAFAHDRDGDVAFARAIVAKKGLSTR